MKPFAKLLAPLLLLALPAHAGRPLATEDAAVLGEKSCQLEAWFDRSSAATEAWAVPACNFGWNVEWQVGGVRTHAAGHGEHTGSFVQGKTAFVSIDDSPWGIGLVVGLVHAPRRETKADWGDPYAIVPLSFRLGEGDSAPLVHFNAGAAHDRADRRTLTLWGVAFEIPATDALSIVGEIYGENSRSFYRLGGRYAVSDTLAFDVTYVVPSSAASGERFVSVGLHYVFEDLLKR